MDEALYFSGVQTEDYSFRYSVLSRELEDDCMVLWIDALGVEWLPLLQWALGSSAEGKIVSACIARATLPTETCFNEQWKQMEVPYKKLDRLDKLAHKGVIDDPDYYSCIEEQISFVSRLREQVEQLLGEYHRVIITGDHGTSRLAARFFHQREGIEPPDGASVCSHGRYCVLPGASPAVSASPAVKDAQGNQYFVFANYDHYVQSGFAAGNSDDRAIYGEIHGGASPEEVLVPVVVVDSLRPQVLKAKWEPNPVKISMRKVRCTLVFNRAVEKLQVKLDTNEGICRREEDGKHWNVEFQRAQKGSHAVSVAADGKLVSVPRLEILPALGDDDFL